MSLIQNKNAFLNRKDAVSIFFCILIACAIFHSLFYTEYLYTDDWVALWQYKKAGFHGLISYGRYLTDVLTSWLYSITGANTVHDLIFIRLFSFLGWILCLPIWYFIIKKAVIREKLPRQLVFFSILYLICTPPFSIYAGWASCLEQFIAQTSGLISGYILYSSIKYKNERIHIPFISIGSAVVFGIISLFTYQNGFGCFFLPFLLHLIAKPKSFRILFIGIAICLLIYVIYYFAFRYSLKITGTGTAYRTKISIDIFPKIRFFFGRALAIPFHFTYLFNEKDLAGSFVYLLIFITWLIFDFYQNRILPLANRL